MVQWLGLCASTAGDTGLIPGQELRSRKLRGTAKKEKIKSPWRLEVLCTVKNRGQGRSLTLCILAFLR